MTVFGNVHTNGTLIVEGQGNAIFDGELTYVIDEDIDSENDFPDPIQVGARDFTSPYPDGYFDRDHPNFGDFDETDPDFTHWSGNRTFNSAPAEGIHVVEGDLTIDDVDGMTGSYTFVSLGGRIWVEGDEQDLEWYYDNLLFYAPREGSGNSCSRTDIRLEDDDNHYTGNVLAPKGRIFVDGDDDWQLNGSLIGWSITLKGDDLTMLIDGDLGGDGEVSIVR